MSFIRDAASSLFTRIGLFKPPNHENTNDRKDSSAEIDKKVSHEAIKVVENYFNGNAPSNEPANQNVMSPSLSAVRSTEKDLNDKNIKPLNILTSDMAVEEKSPNPEITETAKTVDNLKNEKMENLNNSITPTLPFDSALVSSEIPSKNPLSNPKVKAVQTVSPDVSGMIYFLQIPLKERILMQNEIKNKSNLYALLGLSPARTHHKVNQAPKIKNSPSVKKNHHWTP